MNPILSCVEDGMRSASEIAEATEYSIEAVYQELVRLEACGLVRVVTFGDNRAEWWAGVNVGCEPETTAAPTCKKR